VTVSADLSHDGYVSAVSAASFYWLRQLYRVRRSLDNVSAATLVHAFVASRIDYCNALSSCSKGHNRQAAGVLNAAARVFSGTVKCGLSRHFTSDYISLMFLTASTTCTNSVL